MMFREYGIAIIVSVTMHALLIAFVFVGWETTTPPRVIKPPQHIDAKLVELKPKAKEKVGSQKKPKIVDLTAQQRELEKKQKIEAEKRQQKLKEDAEQKKRKALADAEKKRLEEEKKKKADELKKQEQKQRQDMARMEEELLKEQGLLQEEQYATEAQSYVSLIQKRIEQNWSRPPSARKGMSCILAIEMVPNGRVINVDLVEGSGNSAFDRSAITAVRKAEVFPEMKQVPIEVFDRHFRKISLRFTPGDLRL